MPISGKMVFWNENHAGENCINIKINVRFGFNVEGDILLQTVIFENLTLKKNRLALLTKWPLTRETGWPRIVTCDMICNWMGFIMVPNLSSRLNYPKGRNQSALWLSPASTRINDPVCPQTILFKRTTFLIVIPLIVNIRWRFSKT